MPTDHDTVIAEQCFDVDFAQAVRAKLAGNERRYPVEVARRSNRKAR